MITDSNKQLAQWAMEYALKNGCQSSRVSIYNASNNSIEVRDMKIDHLQQASENSLVIQLYVDGRYSSFSTNRLNKAELEVFIKNGIDSTRYLAEDRARALPDSLLYYKGEMPDLELYDHEFANINPDDRVRLALNNCEEIMGKDKRIISINTSYNDAEEFKYMVASNGFEGSEANSYFSVSASVSVKGTGDARPSSFWYDSSLFYDSLIKEGQGVKALEKVIRKLGQKKTKSGLYTMVVDNMTAGRLLSPVLSSLYGSSIQQQNSFLIDKLNNKVASDKMILTDEPHIKRTSGARYFDGEGVATKRLPIFEKGVLNTYFIDTYSANKMGVQQTISSPSIITMQLGDKDTDGLVSTVDKGILITGLNGGNCNSTTGDFSYGVEGFLIENGKQTQPVSEMNITGNMISLWNNLRETGNNPHPSSSMHIPALVFDDVNFSGL
jgi:Predicted Zn-dependent proteases and their inactivated homologs